jgi:hypothetical protein
MHEAYIYIYTHTHTHTHPLPRCDPTQVMASPFFRFPDHTQWHTTVGRTPLDEWSACCRDFYLTTHNRQTSMPPVGFEPKISAGKPPQTYALGRAATGTGIQFTISFLCTEFNAFFPLVLIFTVYMFMKYSQLEYNNKKYWRSDNNRTVILRNTQVEKVNTDLVSQVCMVVPILTFNKFYRELFLKIFLFSVHFFVINHFGLLCVFCDM